MNTVTENYWLIYAAATVIHVWPYHVGFIFSHWVNLKLHAACRFHALLIVTISSLKTCMQSLRLWLSVNMYLSCLRPKKNSLWYSGFWSASRSERWCIFWVLCVHLYTSSKVMHVNMYVSRLLKTDWIIHIVQLKYGGYVKKSFKTQRGRIPTDPTILAAIGHRYS